METKTNYSVFCDVHDDLYEALVIKEVEPDEFSEDISEKDDQEMDIFFDSCARAFAKFVQTNKSLNVHVNKDHIFAFMVSTCFKRLNVASCNPEKLNNVCEKLAQQYV